jgi:hypothetical protein
MAVEIEAVVFMEIVGVSDGSAFSLYLLDRLDISGTVRGGKVLGSYTSLPPFGQPT